MSRFAREHKVLRREMTDAIELLLDVTGVLHDTLRNREKLPEYRASNSHLRSAAKGMTKVSETALRVGMDIDRLAL